MRLTRAVVLSAVLIATLAGGVPARSEDRETEPREPSTEETIQIPCNCTGITLESRKVNNFVKKAKVRISYIRTNITVNCGPAAGVGPCKGSVKVNPPGNADVAIVGKGRGAEEPLVVRCEEPECVPEIKKSFDTKIIVRTASLPDRGDTKTVNIRMTTTCGAATNDVTQVIVLNHAGRILKGASEFDT